MFANRHRLNTVIVTLVVGVCCVALLVSEGGERGTRDAPLALLQQSLFVETPGNMRGVSRKRVVSAVLRFEKLYTKYVGKSQTQLDDAMVVGEQLHTVELSSVAKGTGSSPPSGGEEANVLRDLLGGVSKDIAEKYETEKSNEKHVQRSLSHVEQLLLPSESQKEKIAETLQVINQREARIEKRIELKDADPKEYSIEEKAAMERRKNEEAMQTKPQAVDPKPATDALKPASQPVAKPATVTGPKWAATADKPAAVQQALNTFATAKAGFSLPEVAVNEVPSVKKAAAVVANPLSKKDVIEAATEADAKDKAQMAAGRGAGGIQGQLAAAEAISLAGELAKIKKRKAAASSADHKAIKVVQQVVAKVAVTKKVKAVSTRISEGAINKPAAVPKKADKKEINPLNVIDQALTAETVAAKEAKIHDEHVKAQEAKEKAAKHAVMAAAQAKKEAAAKVATETAEEIAKRAEVQKKADEAEKALKAKEAKLSSLVSAPKAVAAAADEPSTDEHASDLDLITMAMKKEAARERSIKVVQAKQKPVSAEVKRLNHLFGGKVGSKIEDLFTKMKKSKAAAVALAKKTHLTKADLLKPLPMPGEIRKQVAEAKAEEVKKQQLVLAEQKIVPTVNYVKEKRLSGQDMDKIALKDLHNQEGDETMKDAVARVLHKQAETHVHKRGDKDAEAMKDLMEMQKEGLIKGGKKDMGNVGDAKNSVDPEGPKLDHFEKVLGGEKGGRLPRLMDHLFGKAVASKYASETQSRKSGVSEELSQLKPGSKVVSASLTAEDLQAAKDLEILKKNPKLGLLGGGPKAKDASSSWGADSSNDDSSSDGYA